MVEKSKCAYHCKGKCLLCKRECKVELDMSICADAIRRAVHRSMQGLPVRRRPMESAKDRFRAATEGARGWDVYRSCKSKIRYKSDIRAEKEARRMFRRYGEESRIYYCKFCNGYHLATTHGKAQAMNAA